MKETYTVEITPLDKKDLKYTITIETEDLQKSMTQFQRNRNAFNWEILENV